MTSRPRDTAVSTPTVTSADAPAVGYEIRRFPASQRPADGPVPLVRTDGSVIVPPALVPAVRRAVVADLAARQRADGGALTAEAHAFLYALRTAVQARNTPPLAGSSADATAPLEAGTVDLDAHGRLGLVTAGEAADLLGSSAEWIRRLARRGTLPARRVGPQWLIDRAALDDYRHGRTNGRSAAA